ncbi:MAG: hypothetical protein LBD17_00485 [Endomicrobium sp.]|jgi:tRNA A37 threonylcarbamoyladenosine biosynthesis protein TsaE|nr:hypothetical protein [Endomicrobium sp.]
MKILNKIEINDKFEEAIDLIDKTQECIFVTGNAGTGKTLFLSYYMMHGKKAVVLAPRGLQFSLVAGKQSIHFSISNLM